MNTQLTHTQPPPGTPEPAPSQRDLSATPSIWPFPRDGNPVPWTRKQIAAYDAARRDELGEAPL